MRRPGSQSRAGSESGRRAARRTHPRPRDRRNLPGLNAQRPPRHVDHFRRHARDQGHRKPPRARVGETAATDSVRTADAGDARYANPTRTPTTGAAGTAEPIAGAAGDAAAGSSASTESEIGRAAVIVANRRKSAHKPGALAFVVPLPARALSRGAGCLTGAETGAQRVV